MADFGYRFFWLKGKQFGVSGNKPFRWFYWHRTPDWRIAGGLRIFTFEIIW
jgi:hypothetical protein